MTLFLRALAAAIAFACLSTGSACVGEPAASAALDLGAAAGPGISASRARASHPVADRLQALQSAPTAGASDGPARGEPSGATCQNVMAFGASTAREDNAAAFQQAVDAAAGGCVWVPAGEWRGVSNIVIGGNGTTIRCASRDFTFMRPAGPADVVFSARGGSGKWILDCAFRSYLEGHRQTAGALVEFRGTYNSGIENFSIRDAFRGLYDHGNGAFHARNGMIRRTSEYRVAIDGNSADHFYENIVGDNDGGGGNTDPDQSRAGVFIRSGGGIYLTNMDMIHSGVPLWVRPDTDGPVQWLFVSGFAGDTSLFSCMTFEAAGDNIQGASIVNSWSSNCHEDGVRVIESGGTIGGIAFTNQRAFVNGRHNVHLVSGRDVSFVNSQFAGSGGNNVQVESGMGPFSFNGGKVGVEFGMAQSPINIRIESGKPGPFSIVGVNVVGAAGVTISDASSTTSKVIFGNIGSPLNVVNP